MERCKTGSSDPSHKGGLKYVLKISIIVILVLIIVFIISFGATHVLMIYYPDKYHKLPKYMQTFHEKGMDAMLEYPEYVKKNYKSIFNTGVDNMVKWWKLAGNKLIEWKDYQVKYWNLKTPICVKPACTSIIVKTDIGQIKMNQFMFKSVISHIRDTLHKIRYGLKIHPEINNHTALSKDLNIVLDNLKKQEIMLKEAELMKLNSGNRTIQDHNDLGEDVDCDADTDVKDTRKMEDRLIDLESYLESAFEKNRKYYDLSNIDKLLTAYIRVLVYNENIVNNGESHLNDDPHMPDLNLISMSSVIEYKDESEDEFETKRETLNMHRKEYFDDRKRRTADTSYYGIGDIRNYYSL